MKTIIDAVNELNDDLDDRHYQLKAHKRNTEEILKLTKFLVDNGIGLPGESSIGVAIRELSEKHNIDTRTDEEKAVQDILKVISNLPTWSCKSRRLIAYIKKGGIHGVKWSANNDN